MMSLKEKKLINCGLEVDRRFFLKSSVIALLGFSFPVSSFAKIAQFSLNEKSICLYNVHTGETLENHTYWADGDYIPENMVVIDHFFRDYRTAEVKKIDPELMDLLYALSQKLDVKKPVNVISGYRSSSTNYMLRKEGNGVAKHSLHMEGKAADIRIPGVDSSFVRKLAMNMKRGGVGFYPASDFVHLDTGRFRFWKG